MPARSVTIHLREGEEDIKAMLAEIRKREIDGNHFYNLSESEIAKRLLKKPLREIYEKICSP